MQLQLHAVWAVDSPFTCEASNPRRVDASFHTFCVFMNYRITYRLFKSAYGCVKADNLCPSPHVCVPASSKTTKGHDHPIWFVILNSFFLHSAKDLHNYSVQFQIAAIFRRISMALPYIAHCIFIRGERSSTFTKHISWNLFTFR
jgi:hypothetical protein